MNRRALRVGLRLVGIAGLVWVLFVVRDANHGRLLVAVARNACFFGLIALGYALILEATGFFNFALGANTMLGALVAAYVTTNTSMSLFFAVLAGALVSGTACVLTDLLVIGPIERRGSGEELPALVAVTAVLFLLQQLGGTFFGRAPLPGSDWVDGVPVRLGSTSIPRQVLVTAAVTFVIFTAVALWMRRTELGRLLRAIGDSPGAAQILGLPVKQVRILAFAAAGVIVAIAGCLFSATSGVQADNGFTWTLYGFFALVVGGRASIFGPLVGGVCLALVQTYAVFVFGGGALQYSTLVVGLLFFVLKPTGILTRQLRT